MAIEAEGRHPLEQSVPVDLFDISGRVVVVTGGLGQLGRSYALGLVERGARVAVLDSRVDDELVRERYGGRAEDEGLMFVRSDVTQRSSIEAGLETINASWGAPHALVNNAALDSPPGAPAEENGPFERYRRPRGIGS